jgi:hypothetical protein
MNKKLKINIVTEEKYYQLFKNCSRARCDTNCISAHGQFVQHMQDKLRKRLSLFGTYPNDWEISHDWDDRFCIGICLNTLKMINVELIDTIREIIADEEDKWTLAFDAGILSVDNRFLEWSASFFVRGRNLYVVNGEDMLIANLIR